MRILITGGAGFLGGECAIQFIERGHDVFTTDKTGRVDILGDLSNSAFVDSLPDADVVVNCAAVQYVTKDIPLFSREEFFYRNNVQSAENLARRYSRSPTHFVHIGTSMMYEQTGQEHYTTKSPMKGEGVYSRSKLLAQRHLEKLPTLATVIPCIIGGKGREGLFNNFVKMMVKFGTVTFPGQGMHKLHMVHVVDVASLIVIIAEAGKTGIYNAAAPHPLSIRQWIDEIENELGIHRVKIISLPLLPIKLISQMTFYRLLAREQLIMLKKPHVLSTVETEKLGWKPKFSNSKIARDIAHSIIGKMNAVRVPPGAAPRAEIKRPMKLKKGPK
jgi:nucleoside-diphosphate-sugar epimerase